MNLRDKVLQKAQHYIDNKNYDLDRVKESKIKRLIQNTHKEEATYEFEVGDRVKLLEQNDFGIVYEKKITSIMF